MKKFSARKILLGFAWLITTVSALGAGAYGHKYRSQIRAMFNSMGPSAAITTNLHLLKVEKLVIPAEGRDGGIAVLGDGLLLINRLGKSWYVDGARTLRPLDLQVPVNTAEFEADPYNKKTILHELFGVKDIAVQAIPSGIRVFATHSHWNREQQCNTLRVSMVETTTDKLLAGGAGIGTWRLLFETTPCLALEKTPEGGQRLPLGAGGRLEPLADGAVLLTVGGFDPETELVKNAPQKPDNSYGKTLRIDPVTGESRIFTLGHRNPQGLAVSRDGRIWMTEHAARGGDELNLLGESKNYGYPHVSYGTQYEEMTWPLSNQQGRHEGFEKPMYVWTPSIGISQLIVLSKATFPTWQGDLIVSSLGGLSLYRVRVEDNRTIFAEPIPIGHRIRDIVEAANGAIVLKTDDNFLVYLMPLDAATAATPLERGTVLAATCQACHSMTNDGGARIGPSLWNIAGRQVASEGGFEYSAALQAVKGRWTPEMLQRYIANPSEFAPGTTMQIGTAYSEAELADLVAYLQTLK
ncbi:MAG TPA: PQQ-dependent sugar dehydrogenase [Longimicrobiales bacterium]|nr:PQQ-dependent sugar dehydrogenase [Longimicrobiales bacterium]